MDPTSVSLKRLNDDESQSTPSKKSNNSSSISFDTPYRHSSSVTNENRSSQVDTPAKRAQEELLRILQVELGAAVHESEHTCEAFCPDPDNRASAILDDLHKKGAFTPSAVGGAERVTIKGWPTGGDERTFYKPFVNLLNAIVQSFKKRYPKIKSYYADQSIKFFSYDKPMAETVENSDFLKPDLIGASEDHFLKEQCSWFVAEILGEVESEWKKLIVQAGSYARSAFAAADNRSFIPLIAFNHTTAVFRLSFFHRGGLISTLPMNILTRDGFERFVSAITGMWNWENAEAAGRHSAQSHSHFSFNDKLYQINHLFCRRNALRGRATRVFGLQREPQGTLSTGPPPMLQQHLKPQRKPLEPLLRPKSARPAGTIQLENIELPESLVVKCSYPLLGRDFEEAIFLPVKQYIGIVDIITAYDIPCVQTPDGVGYWPVLDANKTAEHQPELRLHRHLLFRTVGRSLRAAHGPRELGYAVLHAMIGHCALFTVGGYVHRDVSNGNILLLDTVEERDVPPCLTGIIESKDCIGVLSDGDAAKKWGDLREPAIHRSGTKPFISNRIIQGWKEQVPIVHTPIDDLESFIWVLYYTLLELDTDLPPDATVVWNQLQCDKLGEISDAKGRVFNKWSNKRRLLKQAAEPRSIRPFFNLLCSWFATADFYDEELSLLLQEKPRYDEIQILSTEAYKRYIKEGIEHISLLPVAFEQNEPN
ncbi:hypothetical protein HGRIS_008755 [Hohenbuehelia grisea]|uniref:Fungal-type protein kinase domain-containing protein n=1 Tax=Hohenbuehelia grisea TaxID=104357 RepID=A0ABR3J9G0_9AGAR